MFAVNTPKQLYWNRNGYPTCSCLCNTLFWDPQTHLSSQFAPFISLYHHYIDDVFGVWLHHSNSINNNDAWKHFQSTMNSYGSLTWTFTCRSPYTHLMDLTITVSSTAFSAALHEKSLNLYQYLLQHSSHAPGNTKDFITGLIHCTLRLMTHTADQQSAICLLFTSLYTHGHNSHALKSLFHAMIQ